jgi:ubiquinone/menaquinone biosynthesis C-methylase UbiE
MHKKIYHCFEEILSRFSITGKVLEIGAVPTKDSLLLSPVLKEAQERIGINIDGGESMTSLADKIEENNLCFKIITGNSNYMPMFTDGQFQVVLSNATLEHDKYFWKSIAEMKRVLAVNGIMVIGVPGYVKEIKHEIHAITTLTHRVHNWPGDYYRFSEQACKEIFFEDFEVTEQKIVIPHAPKIVTCGIKLAYA